MTPETFTRVAKALSDQRRFEILVLVAAEGEIGCQRLCEHFPVSQATISHHLKELTIAGLVAPRRDGQCVHYRLLPSTMIDYVDELQRRVPTGRGMRPGAGVRVPDDVRLATGLESESHVVR